MRSLRILPSLLLTLLIASCSDAPVPTIPAPTDEGPSLNTVAWVSVCCGGTFNIGGSTTMTATAYDQNGIPVQFPFYSWSSSNSSVASISGSGSSVTVSFNAPGTATITVSSGGKFTHTNVQVLAPPVVTTVTLTPSPADVAVGATTQLSASVLDQYGNPYSGGTRTWSSANTSIATVSSSGLVTGVAPGNTTVQLTVNGVSTTVPVRVGRITLTPSGPTWVTSAGQYNWGVSATGGNGSFSYSWSLEQPYTAPGNLVPLGSAASQSLWVDSTFDGYFIVHVTVTSGAQSETTAVGVCNLIVGMSC